MTYRLFLPLLILSASLTGTAQASIQTNTQLSISSLSFLAGRWTDNSPDSPQEETWSPVIGKSVIGTFRIVKSGHAVFLELWSVEEQDGKTVMLLKHYNVGLKGWEEKDKAIEMELTKTGPNIVEFSGDNVTLHYERTGDDLVATVIHMRAGKAETESFRLKKAATEAK